MAEPSGKILRVAEDWLFKLSHWHLFPQRPLSVEREALRPSSQSFSGRAGSNRYYTPQSSSSSRQSIDVLVRHMISEQLLREEGREVIAEVLLLLVISSSSGRPYCLLYDPCSASHALCTATGNAEGAQTMGK